MNNYKIFILSLLLLTTTSIASEIKTVVSILPIKYLVQRIGGEKIVVETLIGQNQNPELYEPQPKQITTLNKVTIYYQIGLPFEKIWLKKISALNPNIVIINLRQGVKFIYSQGALDPHIWTSPLAAKQIAKNILDSLTKADIKNKSFYIKNYDNLINDLEHLDRQISAKLTNIKPRTFLVFHPSWGYFAEHYQLKQLAIEIEGKETGPKDLMKTLKEIKREKLKVMFIQPQFGNTQAKAFADSLRLNIDILDPLAEDYINNLRNVAEKIAKSLNLP